MPTHPPSPRRIKLVLAYRGTKYHGWQMQPNVLTVQGTVERCLARITNAPVRLHASGRTDAGVHALGQVAHFDTLSSIALTALVRGLNSLLPADIAVRRADEVGADFHARYDARQKTYAYIIHNHPIRSVFYLPYVWHIFQPLDVAAMRRAASTLVGRHDFSAFRAATCSAHSPVRHLTHLGLKRQAERLFIVLRADGFLQYMARNIVGTLVQVGRGAVAADAVSAILQSRDRQAAGQTAPPQGLFLVRVRYDRDVGGAGRAAGESWPKR